MCGDNIFGRDGSSIKGAEDGVPRDRITYMSIVEKIRHNDSTQKD